MSAIDLPETMTHWGRGANNGTGGHSYAQGVAVPCRHADRVQQVRTAEGDLVDSMRSYYSKTVLSVGDKVALGDFSALPSPADESREVVAVRSNPTMSDLSKAFT